MLFCLTDLESQEVHYPAHVESLRILRPDLVPVSLEEWFRRNHDPGARPPRESPQRAASISRAGAPRSRPT